MNLAKDLAWQKIFSGPSTNLKIEKSIIFFLHFRYSHPLFLFPNIKWTYEITTENIEIKWALNRLTKL